MTRRKSRYDHSVERVMYAATLPKLEDMAADSLLTRNQAAAIINVSAKTIANREAAGRPILSVVRVGNIPRYRVGDIRELMRREQIKPAAA